MADVTESEAGWLWGDLLEPGEVPIATTGVVDGECLTKEALMQMAEQVRRLPLRMNVEHVPGVNPVGWIESARVVELDNKEFGLVGRAKFLTTEDFLPPSRLTTPNTWPQHDETQERISVMITYDDRDLDTDDVNVLEGIGNERVAINTRGSARRYAIEPVTIVAVTVAVFPFVKRLSEHLADDAHEALRAGLGALIKRKRRRTQDPSIYYVFEHQDRHGAIELVARVATVETMADVWVNLDSGLATAKAWLAANRQLRSVSFVWDADSETWQVSYAVTKDYKVVAASAVMGMPTGAGVKIVRISTLPGR